MTNTMQNFNILLEKYQFVLLNRIYIRIPDGFHVDLNI